jgi:hypothetical protein
MHAAITGTKLHMRDPIWEEKGRFTPVNRVEAAMFIERWQKATEGKLRVVPKAIAHAEGTNMVRCPCRHSLRQYNLIPCVLVGPDNCATSPRPINS